MSLFKAINLPRFVGFTAPDRIEYEDLVLNTGDFLRMLLLFYCFFPTPFHISLSAFFRVETTVILSPITHTHTQAQKSFAQISYYKYSSLAK